MSNVIQFLESVGQDATLRHAEKSELELVLKHVEIDQAIHQAILREDRHTLETLLECAPNICCGIFPGKEDEDESEEEPSKDDEEIRARSAERRVA